MPIEHTSRRESLEAILRALEAYPPKRLVLGARETREGGRCAIGAYAWHTHDNAEDPCNELFQGVFCDVMTQNDSIPVGGSLEERQAQRYTGMIAWLREGIEACHRGPRPAVARVEGPRRQGVATGTSVGANSHDHP